MSDIEIQESNKAMTNDRSKKTFKGRLGRTITMWFMMFSIIPMTIVAACSYIKALNSLKNEVMYRSGNYEI